MSMQRHATLYKRHVPAGNGYQGHLIHFEGWHFVKIVVHYSEKGSVVEIKNLLPFLANSLFQAGMRLHRR